MFKRGKGKGRVVVSGAGAAGLSAALCAARLGHEVQLLEASGQIGGTIRRAGLHTLAGFLNRDGQPVESEICREFTYRLNARKRKMGRYWVLECEPSEYLSVTQNWLAEFPSLQLRLRSKLRKLEARRDRIVRAATDDHEFNGDDLIFIDATGDGEVAALLDQCRHVPEEDSWGHTTRLRQQKKSLLQRLALKFEIEKKDPRIAAWVDEGFGDLFVKLNAASPKGPQWSNRNGARLISLEPDHQTFLVHWPIEAWRGRDVTLDHAAPVQIPQNYLASAKYVNLFAAGKCAGIPSPMRDAARVAGGCWTMGERAIHMALT